MAALPNKQFWVNWNARNYDSATHTISKESGQLFSEDLVLRNAAQTYTDTYVTIDSINSRVDFNFNSTSDNPFNRTASTASMTFIAKVASSSNVWFVSNRKDGTVGWMVKLGKPKYQMAYTDNYNEYSSSTTPTIFTWRCGNGTQQWIDHTNNVVGTPYADTTWVGLETTRTTFLGGNTSLENWTGDFYWLYISPEVLTDAEIQAVIDYNENTDVFEADKYEVDFGYAGGTDTITVTADNSWSCTTPTGFSVSPTSGSAGTTTVTVTTNRSGTEKTGTAVFTDSNSNTFDVVLTQSGDGLLFPFKKIIHGTRRIN